MFQLMHVILRVLTLSVLIPFHLLFMVYPATVYSQGDSPCPENAIILGMSTALTGPASYLGLNMQIGIDAAFHEINISGGVQGRELCLISMDDGYEPFRTGPNIKELLVEHQVLALIGNVGTPTAVVTIPLANKYKTLFFGAFTGAGILRKNPPDRYVINYRASYEEETSSMVDALVRKGVGVDEIVFFTQRDAYGDAGFYGGITALARHGLKEKSKVVHGRYERNTLNVEEGLADILLAEPAPKAVILVGSYAPCAQFIQLAGKSGLDVMFLNVSFVGSTPLLNELGIDAEGVIITQVVPHYYSNFPLVLEFRKALSQWNPQANLSFGALEGYISARIFIKALQENDGDLTRESIIDSLENLGQFDIGLGRPMYLSKEHHQASNRVWPTIIRDGKFLSFDW